VTKDIPQQTSHSKTQHQLQPLGRGCNTQKIPHQHKYKLFGGILTTMPNIQHKFKLLGEPHFHYSQTLKVESFKILQSIVNKSVLVGKPKF
jgi:hypothetical protein